MPSKKENRGASRQIALVGVLVALAVVIGYLERMFPPLAPVPGWKPGFANVVVLLALYMGGTVTGFLVMGMKVLLSAVFYGGFSGMLYGLAGGLLSFTAMYMAKKAKVFSVAGVSMLGGVCHNMGQISLASLVVQNPLLLTYLPLLIVSGTGTGLVTGLITGAVLQYHGRFAIHS